MRVYGSRAFRAWFATVSGFPRLKEFSQQSFAIPTARIPNRRVVSRVSGFRYDTPKAMPNMGIREA